MDNRLQFVRKTPLFLDEKRVLLCPQTEKKMKNRFCCLLDEKTNELW